MFAYIVQLFIKIFVIKADNDFSYEVHEPRLLSTILIEEINHFRAKLYSRKMPYLLAPTQIQIEEKLTIDQRSFHILARRKTDGAIVGCLRLTPFPFELTELYEDTTYTDYQDQLEIGRLVTDPSVRNVGKKIMILAGIHAVENTNYKGFVGVVRAEKIRYFENFGMKIISPVINLKGRPHNYLTITSDFNTMRTSVRKNVLKRFSTPLTSFMTKAKYE